MKDELARLAALMHSGGIAYAEATREFKRRYILYVLNANRGNQCKAARELGMHRNTLSRTIAELSLVRMAGSNRWCDAFEDMRRKENGTAPYQKAMAAGA